MDKKINKQRKNETTIKRRYGIKNIVLTMFLGLGIIPLFTMVWGVKLHIPQKDGDLLRQNFFK